MDNVIVVGAGPAGMMAAIKAAENGAAVLVLEKMKQPGKKMLITGKGRCNITNTAEIPELIKNTMRMYSIFSMNLMYQPR